MNIIIESSKEGCVHEWRFLDSSESEQLIITDGPVLDVGPVDYYRDIVRIKHSRYCCDKCGMLIER